jgi:hypothetical protein
MSTENSLRSSLHRVIDLLLTGASSATVNAALNVLEHDIAAWKKEAANEMVATRRK